MMYDSVFNVQGINFWIVLLIALWTLPWKGLALWRASHRNDKWWFIVFLIVNTAGIIEIIYLIFTRKKSSLDEKISLPPSAI